MAFSEVRKQNGYFAPISGENQVFLSKKCVFHERPSTLKCGAPQARAPGTLRYYHVVDPALGSATIHL